MLDSGSCQRKTRFAVLPWSPRSTIRFPELLSKTRTHSRCEWSLMARMASRRVGASLRQLLVRLLSRRDYVKSKAPFTGYRPRRLPF